MNDNRLQTPHPYSLEVVPPAQAGGQYHWVIRREGKLLQRSDRSLPTEAKARASGVEAVERLLRDR